MATPSDNSIISSTDPIYGAFVNGLIEGASWTFPGPRVITYSLNHTVYEGTAFSWTSTYSSAISQAFSAWSAVANIQFTQLSSGYYSSDSAADIAIAPAGQILNDLDAAAIGVFPDSWWGDQILWELGSNRVEYPNPEGDLYFNNLYSGMSSTYLQPGGYAYAVFLHEMGHVLGLKHPHDDGANGKPTFGDLGISSYDSGLWTLMSYNDPQAFVQSYGYQSTPMPLDILAIQYMYGANMSYRTGNDTYALTDDGKVKTIWDAGGNDTISALGFGYGLNISLNEGSFIYHGSKGSITAIAYNVVIENATGTAYNDYIVGNQASNILNGAGGGDTLTGGLGDDTYVVDNLSDTVIEYAGEGLDTVQSAISFTLASACENLLLTGAAHINASGNTANNVITGNSGNNILIGGEGEDTLFGGAGNDDYYVDNEFDSVTESASAGIDRVFSQVNFSLSQNIEQLILEGGGDLSGAGNTLNNLLRGNVGNNDLDGGSGNDTLEGGLGSDVYHVDSLLDMVTEVDGAGSDTVWSSVSWTLGAYVENLTLTGAAAINGTGNALDNTVTGNAGDNLLDGGTGNDVLNGGAGNDIYVLDSLLDTVSEDPDHGIDQVRTRHSFTLGGNLEHLVLLGEGHVDGTGNALANTLTGNAGNNVLDGAAGADLLNGGAGNDLYFVDDLGDVVIEISGAGEDRVSSSVSFILGNGVESLDLTGSVDINGTGNARGNVLNGNSGNNTLNGDAGNDILDGGLGSDMLVGGIGNDLYIVDDVGDQVVEEADGGRDVVESSVSFVMGQGLERLILTGVSDINVTGNDFSNDLTGNAGNNTLNGGLGADVMRGGDGDDVYVIDSVGDRVIENAGEGNDTVVTDASHMLLENLENLTLTGRAYYGVGNHASNVITGNTYANRMDGMEGADTLIGGGGNDTYIVDNAADTVIENLIEGTDRVMSSINWTLGDNLELLVLGGTANISGAGNALDNQITGNIGSNVLWGAGGDDLIRGGLGNDILAGGSGSDVLVGGRGFDVFVFDALDAIDVVTDFANGDKIQLDQTIFSALGAGGLSVADFVSGAGVTQAQDATDRIMFNETTGDLYYDVDGSASGSSAVQFAHLNVNALGAQDVSIV